MRLCRAGACQAGTCHPKGRLPGEANLEDIKQVHMPSVALNPQQQDQDAAQQGQSALCGPRGAQGTQGLGHPLLLPAAPPQNAAKGRGKFWISLGQGGTNGPHNPKVFTAHLTALHGSVTNNSP